MTNFVQSAAFPRAVHNSDVFYACAFAVYFLVIVVCPYLVNYCNFASVCNIHTLKYFDLT